MSEPDKMQLRPNARVAAWRVLLVAVPTVLGVAAIGWMMWKQERLVIESPRDAISEGRSPVRIQTPPIYLEEANANKTGHRYLYDSSLGWKNIPGWEAKTFLKPLKINSRGLRDREYELAKPEGVRRILALGDSYTWGYGVAQDEIYTELLETKLNANAVAPWEVINTGVSGYGTDQEFLYLMREGFDWQPDIVVLQFFLLNDPADIRSSSRYGLNKPVFKNLRLEPVNLPVPKPGTDAPEIVTEVPLIDLAVTIIRNMSLACMDHDCKLVVMKFGYRPDLERPEIEAFNTAFNQQVPNLPGVSYLNLDETFVPKGEVYRYELTKGNYDKHWGVFGHQEVARLLEEFLVKEGLVGEATGVN